MGGQVCLLEVFRNHSMGAELGGDGAGGSQGSRHPLAGNVLAVPGEELGNDLVFKDFIEGDGIGKIPSPVALSFRRALDCPSVAAIKALRPPSRQCAI